MMQPQRRHEAVSDDGIRIVGNVHGQGPPMVLVHGAVADGDSEWTPLLPHVTERFTCYLPSTRGRGQSDPHPELSSEALVRDITVFVESIGEPVALVGTSGGGMLSLGVAARTPAVRALAVREPVMFEVMDDETRSRFATIVDEVAAALDRGAVLEGAIAFLGFAANDEEAAALAESDDGMDELAAYLPIDLAEFREVLAAAGPSPTDPASLAQIAAPTLVLHGTRTSQPWFTASALAVAEQVPNASVREIPGAGHFGHVVDPARDAAALVPYLEAAMQPA